MGESNLSISYIVSPQIVAQACKCARISTADHEFCPFLVSKNAGSIPSIIFLMQQDYHQAN
jgi:hypothetical protein